MHVTVRWTWLEDESAPDWETTNCLFAFADPESDEIVYLGDCGASSVRDRCEAAELEPLWADLRGIGIDHVSVLVGKPDTGAGKKVEPPTVAAAAALLVAELQPSGNASDEFQIPEPTGLEVECAGDWPYEETRFIAT